ncbi:MAG: hypothetical protein ACI81P_003555 [Neolewinella sp.]|jgi:hypothetical protein
MHSTPFSPFHVYEIDPKHPAARILPFHYVLCFTQPEFFEPGVNFNVVGFPILDRQPRDGDKRIRLPLITAPDGELRIINGPLLAVDLLQPFNHSILLPHSCGQIKETEKTELKEMVRRFLSL